MLGWVRRRIRDPRGELRRYDPAGGKPPATPEPSASEAAAPVTLTYFVDDNNVTAARLQGLIDAYTAKHPNVTINVETLPAAPKATTSSRPSSPPAT